MKLQQSTLDVFKNFSYINPSIVVKPGSELRTVSIGGDVFARADVSDEFPEEFAISDVPQMLHVLTMFNEPEIEFFENHMEIKSGDKAIRYLYTNPSLVKTKDGNPNFKDPVLKFDVTTEVLKELVKAASVLKVDTVSIESDRGEFSWVVHNRKNSENRYAVKIGVCDPAVNFSIDFKPEYLNFLSGMYTAEIFSVKNGMLLLQVTKDDTMYLVGSNDTSEWN